MNKKNYLLLIALCCAWLCLPFIANGQVKIGESTQPEKGAVLDLKKTAAEGYLGGMLLPRVEILNLGYIPADFTDADKMAGYNAANGVNTNVNLEGMIVFNTNIDKPNNIRQGTYIWDGNDWRLIKATCDDVTAVTITEGAAMTTYSGVNFTLNAATTGGVGITYKWYEGAAEIGTGASITLQKATAGTYTYTVKAYASCEPESAAVTSDPITVTVIDIDAITDGGTTALLTGVACYDVAMTESAACGTLAVRTKHDFVPSAGHNLSYTFTPAVAIDDFQLVFVNKHAAIPIVASVSAGGSSLAANTPHVFTVTFYSTLNDDATGVPASAPAAVTLYAVYKIGSTTYKKELTVRVQDCNCCGAFINGGIWLAFQCHNLGANTALDPMVPNQYIHGAVYKFGAGTPAATQAVAQANPTAIPAWTSFGYQSGNLDWNSNNDPCKEANGNEAGFRLPTESEWFQVVNNATGYSGPNNVITAVPSSWTVNSYENGLKIGDHLFLPAGGNRNYSNGMLAFQNIGYYWAKDQSPASPGNPTYLNIQPTKATTYSANPGTGMSVRCVAD